GGRRPPLPAEHPGRAGGAFAGRPGFGDRDCERSRRAGGGVSGVDAAHAGIAGESDRGAGIRPRTRRGANRCPKLSHTLVSLSPAAGAARSPAVRNLACGWFVEEVSLSLRRSTRLAAPASRVARPEPVAAPAAAGFGPPTSSLSSRT